MNNSQNFGPLGRGRGGRSFRHHNNFYHSNSTLQKNFNFQPWGRGRNRGRGNYFNNRHDWRHKVNQSRGSYNLIFISKQSILSKNFILFSDNYDGHRRNHFKRSYPFDHSGHGEEKRSSNWDQR